ncbi:hypothetical protein SAMN05216525_13212 [Bradyrhizobium sp. Gha]|nr:hypothetical protein SAMN05216525_13212 [Bradyrhizobium sp. Gha]
MFLSLRAAVCSRASAVRASDSLSFAAIAVTAHPDNVRNWPAIENVDSPAAHSFEHGRQKY